MTDRRIPGEIWVLVAAAVTIALGYGIIAPVLPQFAQSFDVGLTAASGIVAAFSVMRLAFAPASGRLIQRFGERRMYLIGLSMVALSTALVAFSQNYVQAVVFRGLGGIGSVTFTVAATGLIVRLSPPAMRGRTASLYSTAFLLGNIAGPILGAALLGFGYRVIFLSYAFALVAAVLVVAVFLREKQGEGADAGDERPIMPLAQAWASPAYRATIAATMANGWTNFGVRIALLPLMAAALPTLGPALAGIALTLFALANAIAQQLTGRLVDARGRRPMVVLGLALSGSATLGFGWATSPVPFLALTALAGVGAAFLGPALQATLGDVIGTQRRGGPAIAASSMAADVGSIAGTLLTGLLADTLGFGPAFAVTGMVMFAALIPWLRIREPERL